MEVQDQTFIELAKKSHPFFLPEQLLAAVGRISSDTPREDLVREFRDIASAALELAHHSNDYRGVMIQVFGTAANIEATLRLEQRSNSGTTSNE
jgi:hypothetical protein